MILIAQERVITLVRPKKHSIHPSGKSTPCICLRVPDINVLDLHVLVNTIYAPSIINSSASASWLPICLPKFNSSAFVNAYVMFLRREAEKVPVTPSFFKTSSPGSQNSELSSEGGQTLEVADHSENTSPREKEKSSPEIGLVCVSGSADFEAVRSWCDTVSRVRTVFACGLVRRGLTHCVQRLTQDGLLQALSDAVDRGDTEYSVADLGIPGLRHFVYKSRSHVQVTLPLFEDPYDDVNEKRRYGSFALRIKLLFAEEVGMRQAHHALSDVVRQHTREVGSG